MDFEQIKDKLKKELKPSRYLHSIGVEEVSHDLALIHGYDIKKARLAGILHDCAKDLSDEELLEASRTYQLSVSEIENRCPFLLHAKVGAVYADRFYGIKDQEILNAIKYHSTGRPAMTLPEKIVFTADYIEPYRKPLPRIDEIRKASYENLDLAVLMILENMLEYFKKTAAEIDTTTIDTYEYYRKAMDEQVLK